MKLPGRIAYAASRTARVAFYRAHYALARRRALATLGAAAAAVPAARGGLPGRAAMARSVVELFARELDHIARGDCPAPPLLPERPFRLLRTARAFFDDVPEVAGRRLAGRRAEVRETAGEVEFPPYYLQNFHFQTGGWLTEGSAEIYDHQVEVLFTGTADAMRRRGLVPFRRRFAGQRRPRPLLVDLGSGTGRFAAMLRRTLPQARVVAVEPSPAYRRHAERLHPGLRAKAGFAEALPFDDASVDGLAAVWLFHELPPEIRRAALAEIARVLVPGGMFVLVDALQTGDRPEFDGLLGIFPERFHEPYFASWLTCDMTAMAAAHGLLHRAADTAFLSKILVFERTARAT